MHALADLEDQDKRPNYELLDVLRVAKNSLELKAMEVDSTTADHMRKNDFFRSQTLDRWLRKIYQQSKRERDRGEYRTVKERSRALWQIFERRLPIVIRGFSMVWAPAKKKALIAKLDELRSAEAHQDLGL